MASRYQRREKYGRRRAHALRLDGRRRRHYTIREELLLFGDVNFKRKADGTVEHLARDIIDFANKYMVSAHRMEPWQERVIKDVVRSL